MPLLLALVVIPSVQLPILSLVHIWPGRTVEITPTPVI